VELSAELNKVNSNFSFHPLSFFIMKNYYTHPPTPTRLSFQIRNLLLAGLFVCSAFSLHAQTTWTGANSADWNTATNWSAGVPDAADDVTIPNITPAPILSTAAVAKSVRVQSGASLSIAAAGSLAINGSTGTGFTNNGTLTNAGNLLIGNESNVAGVGVDNSGTINNNTGGHIQIDRTGSHAVTVSGSGVFNNASLIQIGSLATVNGQGIAVTGGTFTNNLGGEIIINRTGAGLGGDGILSFGIFTNYAKITIGDVALGAQDDIYNTGTFTNAATGEIRIDGAFGNGIWNLGNGLFQNDGKIFLGSVRYTGATGILNSGNSTFTNSAGATLQIDRVNRGMTNTNLFTNGGLLRIGTTVAPTDRGILNIRTVPANPEPVFTNLACGIIEVFGQVANENGTLTNHGLLTVNNSQEYKVPVVRINSPGAVAKTYIFSTAQFGPPLTNVNLTANAVFVNDGTADPTLGCNSPLTNSAQLSGKIALVDRGTCSFSQKVYYAQQAGAIAVIVFNNVPGGGVVLWGQGCLPIRYRSRW
jgi:hypothetical protein